MPTESPVKPRLTNYQRIRKIEDTLTQTLGTGGDTEGMAGTTGDERQELFFLVTRCTFATLSKTGRSRRHGASLIRPVFKE
jgi:hypothetical protein